MSQSKQQLELPHAEHGTFNWFHTIDEGFKCYWIKRSSLTKCPMEAISVKLSSLKEKSENVGYIYSTTDHDHCGAVVLN